MWEWAEQWIDKADAIAGLDDILDWRQSLKNYRFGGFPTYHESDPTDASFLDDLIALSRERGNWLGIGLEPPRSGKLDFVRRTLDRIPPDIHVHGWALREYQCLPKISSVDSTNWFRYAWTIMSEFPWLTYPEALEIMVKKYKREQIHKSDEDVAQLMIGWEE